MADTNAAGVCAMRRALLFGLVGAGVAAASTVAGCAGEEPPADPTVAGPAPSSSGVASPSAPASFEPWPGTGGDAAGGLVKTADVPVGGAVRAKNLLVTQPQRGVFKAFDATCPHQGVTVEPPLAGTDYFECPGHNSKFRTADGSRISGPAPRGLSQVAVKVKNGYVVTA